MCRYLEPFDGAGGWKRLVLEGSSSKREVIWAVGIHILCSSTRKSCCNYLNPTGDASSLCALGQTSVWALDI